MVSVRHPYRVIIAALGPDEIVSICEPEQRVMSLSVFRIQEILSKFFTLTCSACGR